MALREQLDKAFTLLSHPNPNAGPVEHPAHLGAANLHADSDDKLTSAEITERIKSSGNNGSGMDEGLRSKATAQMEQWAERSRLRQEGMLEPHVKHEKLVAFSPEHREVADGARLMEQAQAEKTA